MSSQRVKLALLSKERGDLIDAAISGCQHGELFVDYNKLGIWSDREPQERVIEYKYNIDVDGNSGSWIGLYNKMLAGGVVLKIESPVGFRQWYYNRLEPWINYVPVKTDLSDLIEIMEFLQKNDLLAMEIAKRGLELALSIDYPSALEYGAMVLNKAFLRL
jgi:hypothetical protein